jgi:hypothetical protein
MLTLSNKKVLISYALKLPVQQGKKATPDLAAAAAAAAKEATSPALVKTPWPAALELVVAAAAAAAKEAASRALVQTPWPAAPDLPTAAATAAAAAAAKEATSPALVQTPWPADPEFAFHVLLRPLCLVENSCDSYLAHDELLVLQQTLCLAATE